MARPQRYEPRVQLLVMGYIERGMGSWSLASVGFVINKFYEKPRGQRLRDDKVYYPIRIIARRPLYQGGVWFAGVSCHS